LTVWQVSDSTSPDFGGMIEGESGGLVSIIQTDNTQEAIRVWSRYARMTDDLAKYRENIDNAWIYTLNFPAYSEEGETDYYRLHNCGWGLVAEMEFEEVFTDTTFRQYADSCADFIITHPLTWSGPASFYTMVHPLVTGWCAGALYQYGQFVNNQAYVDSAVVLGGKVKTWIEANPSRLATNEVWAMSGGTAMWGVCNSTLLNNPNANQWLETYAPYMDVYAGPGEWNNSWNIWYAHAHSAIYDFLNDSLYFANAIFLVDTVLSEDTDNDGGVTAGSVDPDSMDQTWISCYTDYMGIERLLSNMPGLDVGVLSFTNPPPNVPIEFGNAIPLQVVVANFGAQFVDTLTVFVEISSIPAYASSALCNLMLTGLDTVDIFPCWQPADTGFYDIVAYTDYPGDLNPQNDSLLLCVEIRASGMLSGRVFNSITGTGISSWVKFYHQEVSNEIPYDSIYTAAPGGDYSITLMAGEYRAEVYPEVPFNIKEFFPVEVSTNANNFYDFSLTPAPLLLVDDDGGSYIDNYIINGLNGNGTEFYYWNRSQNELGGNSTLFPICLWFTGNDSDSTITQVDKDELSLFLVNGGNLILTGQYIGDELGPGDEFLNQYLRVEHLQDADTMVQIMVTGVTGNPISSGSTIYLVGNPGAANQASPSTCLPLAGGDIVYRYQWGSQPIASVSYHHPQYDYHTIYFGFGIEAVSGWSNSTSLPTLLTNIFEWFGYPASVEESRNLSLSDFRLLPPYPNPCNSSTEIRYSIPKGGYSQLTIYNALGQKVCVLWSGTQSPGTYAFQWNGQDHNGFPISSGTYYVNLLIEGRNSTLPLLILK
jgi:hypothetical protein